MANQATINPTTEQKALRNIERYKKLVTLIIPKRVAKGLPVESYQAEADRRKGEIEALKAALAEVD